MTFNKHSEFENLHAFLSPSSYHWINYDDDKLASTYLKRQATVKGTALHEYARQAILLGVKQRGDGTTVSMYVNDAIGYKMTPEQILYFSPNCFGTADAISYQKRSKTLRIHDLKTGTSPTSMRQLYVYMAIFCLEYGMKPSAIKAELRIYQNNEVLVDIPETEMILHIMEKIMHFDKIIEDIEGG